MLKAGTTLCVKCGNVFSKLYYFNSKDNVWVTLNRTVTGKYYVEQRIDENVQDNSKSLNYTDFKY